MAKEGNVNQNNSNKNSGAAEVNNNVNPVQAELFAKDKTLLALTEMILVNNGMSLPDIKLAESTIINIVNGNYDFENELKNSDPDFYIEYNLKMRDKKLLEEKKRQNPIYDAYLDALQLNASEEKKLKMLEEFKILLNHKSPEEISEEAKYYKYKKSYQIYLDQIDAVDKNKLNQLKMPEAVKLDNERKAKMLEELNTFTSNKNVEELSDEANVFDVVIKKDDDKAEKEYFNFLDKFSQNIETTINNAGLNKYENNMTDNIKSPDMNHKTDSERKALNYRKNAGNDEKLNIFIENVMNKIATKLGGMDKLKNYFKAANYDCDNLNSMYSIIVASAIADKKKNNNDYNVDDYKEFYQDEDLVTDVGVKFCNNFLSINRVFVLDVYGNKIGFINEPFLSYSLKKIADLNSKAFDIFDDLKMKDFSDIKVRENEAMNIDFIKQISNNLFKIDDLMKNNENLSVKYNELMGTDAFRADKINKLSTINAIFQPIDNIEHKFDEPEYRASAQIYLNHIKDIIKDKKLIEIDDPAVNVHYQTSFIQKMSEELKKFPETKNPNQVNGFVDLGNKLLNGDDYNKAVDLCKNEALKKANEIFKSDRKMGPGWFKNIEKEKLKKSTNDAMEQSLKLNRDAVKRNIGYLTNFDENIINDSEKSKVIFEAAHYLQIIFRESFSELREFDDIEFSDEAKNIAALANMMVIASGKNQKDLFRRPVITVDLNKTIAQDSPDDVDKEFFAALCNASKLISDAQKENSKDKAIKEIGKIVEDYESYLGQELTDSSYTDVNFSAEYANSKNKDEFLKFVVLEKSFIDSFIDKNPLKISVPINNYYNQSFSSSIEFEMSNVKLGDYVHKIYDEMNDYKDTWIRENIMKLGAVDNYWRSTSIVSNAAAYYILNNEGKTFADIFPEPPMPNNILDDYVKFVKDNPIYKGFDSKTFVSDERKLNKALENQANFYKNWHKLINNIKIPNLKTVEDRKKVNKEIKFYRDSIINLSQNEQDIRKIPNYYRAFGGFEEYQKEANVLSTAQAYFTIAAQVDNPAESLDARVTAKYFLDKFNDELTGKTFYDIDAKFFNDGQISLLRSMVVPKLIEKVPRQQLLDYIEKGIEPDFPDFKKILDDGFKKYHESAYENMLDIKKSAAKNVEKIRIETKQKYYKSLDNEIDICVGKIKAEKKLRKDLDEKINSIMFGGNDFTYIDPTSKKETKFRNRKEVMDALNAHLDRPLHEITRQTDFPYSFLYSKGIKDEELMLLVTEPESEKAKELNKKLESLKTEMYKLVVEENYDNIADYYVSYLIQVENNSLRLQNNLTTLPDIANNYRKLKSVASIQSTLFQTLNLGVTGNVDIPKNSKKLIELIDNKLDEYNKNNKLEHKLSFESILQKARIIEYVTQKTDTIIPVNPNASKLETYGSALKAVTVGKQINKASFSNEFKNGDQTLPSNIQFADTCIMGYLADLFAKNAEIGGLDKEYLLGKPGCFSFDNTGADYYVKHLDYFNDFDFMNLDEYEKVMKMSSDDFVKYLDEKDANGLPYSKYDIFRYFEPLNDAIPWEYNKMVEYARKEEWSYLGYEFKKLVKKADEAIKTNKADLVANRFLKMVATKYVMDNGFIFNANLNKFKEFFIKDKNKSVFSNPIASYIDKCNLGDEYDEKRQVCDYANGYFKQYYENKDNRYKRAVGIIERKLYPKGKGLDLELTDLLKLYKLEKKDGKDILVPLFKKDELALDSDNVLDENKITRDSIEDVIVNALKNTEEIYIFPEGSDHPYKMSGDPATISPTTIGGDTYLVPNELIEDYAKNKLENIEFSKITRFRDNLEIVTEKSDSDAAKKFYDLNSEEKAEYLEKLINNNISLKDYEYNYILNPENKMLYAEDYNLISNIKNNDWRNFKTLSKMANYALASKYKDYVANLIKNNELKYSDEKAIDKFLNELLDSKTNLKDCDIFKIAKEFNGFYDAKDYPIDVSGKTFNSDDFRKNLIEGLEKTKESHNSLSPEIKILSDNLAKIKLKENYKHNLEQILATNLLKNAKFEKIEQIEQNDQSEKTKTVSLEYNSKEEYNKIGEPLYKDVILSEAFGRNEGTHMKFFLLGSGISASELCELINNPESEESLKTKEKISELSQDYADFVMGKDINKIATVYSNFMKNFADDAKNFIEDLGTIKGINDHFDMLAVYSDAQSMLRQTLNMNVLCNNNQFELLQKINENLKKTGQDYFSVADQIEGIGVVYNNFEQINACSNFSDIKSGKIFNQKKFFGQVRLTAAICEYFTEISSNSPAKDVKRGINNITEDLGVYIGINNMGDDVIEKITNLDKEIYKKFAGMTNSMSISYTDSVGIYKLSANVEKAVDKHNIKYKLDKLVNLRKIKEANGNEETIKKLKEKEKEINAEKTYSDTIDIYNKFYNNNRYDEILEMSEDDFLKEAKDNLKTNAFYDKYMIHRYFNELKKDKETVHSITSNMPEHDKINDIRIGKNFNEFEKIDDIAKNMIASEYYSQHFGEFNGNIEYCAKKLKEKLNNPIIDRVIYLGCNNPETADYFKKLDNAIGNDNTIRAIKSELIQSLHESGGSGIFTSLIRECENLETAEFDLKQTPKKTLYHNIIIACEKYTDKRFGAKTDEGKRRLKLVEQLKEATVNSFKSLEKDDIHFNNAKYIFSELSHINSGIFNTDEFTKMEDSIKKLANNNEFKDGYSDLNIKQYLKLADNMKEKCKLYIEAKKSEDRKTDKGQRRYNLARTAIAYADKVREDYELKELDKFKYDVMDGVDVSNADSSIKDLYTLSTLILLNTSFSDNKENSKAVAYSRLMSGNYPKFRWENAVSSAREMINNNDTESIKMVVGIFKESQIQTEKTAMEKPTTKGIEDIYPEGYNPKKIFEYSCFFKKIVDEMASKHTEWDYKSEEYDKLPKNEEDFKNKLNKIKNPTEKINFIALEREVQNVINEKIIDENLINENLINEKAIDHEEQKDSIKVNLPEFNPIRKEDKAEDKGNSFGK